MVNITIALVMAVIVTNVYSRKDTYEICPRWIVNIAQRHYPQFVRHLDEREEAKSAQRLQPCNGRQQIQVSGGCSFEMMPLASNACMHSPTHCQQSQKTNSESQENRANCCGLMRVLRTPRTSDGDNSAQQRREGSFARKRRTGSTKPVDLERNCAEWLMVSKCLDRFLFWLYLLISCSLQVALILQMWQQTPESSGDSVSEN